MNIVIICNPVSGRGKALRLARDLEVIAQAHHHRVELIATKSAEHLQASARLLSPSVDVIACAGGDGTLNTLINALPDPSRIPIIQLPTGTANLLAREINLPCAPSALLAIIETGNISHFDLMRINGSRCGLLVASVGIDAQVIAEIDGSRAGALGFRGYVQPILKVMKGYQVPRLRIRCDGEDELINGGMAVVGNVRPYAAFFSITDRARHDSGLLDLCIIPDARKRALLRLLPAARKRQLSQSHRVIYRQVHSLTIATEGGNETAVEVDGEYFGKTPIKIVVEPRSVPILKPE